MLSFQEVKTIRENGHELSMYHSDGDSDGRNWWWTECCHLLRREDSYTEHYRKCSTGECK